MYVVYAHCCGLDVHKRSITACLLVSRAGGKGQHEIRRFGTMTRDLLALADWLQSHHVTHVAMESTGVYWKAPYYLLEDAFEVLLVNAAHLTHVPGRKTDLLTELPGRAGGRGVRGRSGLARFPRRDQRRGSAAAGAVRAGGAAVRVA